MTKKLLSKKGFISKQASLKLGIKNESIIDNHQVEHHRELIGDLKEAASIDVRIPALSLLNKHSIIDEVGIQKQGSILGDSGIKKDSTWEEFSKLDTANPLMTQNQYSVEDSMGNNSGGGSSLLGHTIGIPSFKPGQIGVTGSSIGIGSVDVLTGSASGSNSEFDQQFRSAVSQGRGMASDVSDYGCWAFGTAVGAFTAWMGGPAWVAPAAGGACIFVQNNSTFEEEDPPENAQEQETTNTLVDLKMGSKPGVDDTGGGTVDPQVVGQMDEEIKNFINPSSTPCPDGDCITQYSDSLTSPDPSTLRNQFINWGDESTSSGSFPAPDFNTENVIDPSVNWGDSYTDMGPVVSVGTPVGTVTGSSFDQANRDSGLELVPTVDNF